MKKGKFCSQLQEYYEHLRTVREILIRSSSIRFFRKSFTVSLSPNYVYYTEVQLFCFLPMNKYICLFTAFK
jgi:hypothetical protein